MPDATAPAGNTAPPTPIAPAGPSADRIKESRLDPSIVMEETIRSTLDWQGEKEARETAIAELPPRDPKSGKFLAKDAQIAAQQAAAGEPKQAVAPGVEGQEPAAAAAEGTEGEAVPEGEVVIPEGYASPAVLPPERAQGFKVRDAEGELEPPDLTWELATAQGPRAFTTDQLVNLARQGNYNHQLQQQNQAVLEQVNGMRSEYEELQTYARALESKYVSLMGSDDAYVAARAEWDRRNTPEAQLAREREQRVEAEQRAELVQLQAAGTAYYSSAIEPAIKQIAAALPGITQDELGMRLLLVTDHLRVRTPAGNMYPASVYQQVAQALLNDVVPWAQQLHAHRVSSAPQPTKDATANAAKARQEADQAKIRAQKARRVASAATRPVAGAAQAGAPNGARPSAGKVLHHKDAEAAVIGQTLAAMRTP
jgi:hypothetical protein